MPHVLFTSQKSVGRSHNITIKCPYVCAYETKYEKAQGVSKVLARQTNPQLFLMLQLSFNIVKLRIKPIKKQK